ncbi:RNA polymerase Rpc34 [Lophium mytilinum]|uniref:DNA-directed RNA polymerase III subunit RPC6 n=1 Tax=Lophium mytilinum TaxID=390894 RepID=A0A6A6QP63_9PEZI|nr:RNA polymerase Rpc34 [Lophium mytilinum]
MATPPPPPPDTKASKMSKLDQLYEKCAALPPETVFHQRDLADMQVTDDSNGLLLIIQQMVASWLMLTLQWDGAPCWKIRPREVAAAMKTLVKEEREIYLAIEATGTQAIWTKSLKSRTGQISQTVLNKTLKHLQAKGLIKCISNIKFPTRKYYILAGLEASEDIVGGPWHGDGELDLDLIDAISEIVVRYVEKESWVEQKSAVNKLAIAKKRAAVLKAQDAAAANQPESIPDIESTPPLFRPYLGQHGFPLIPQPAGYKHYPTCASILDHIVGSGLLNNLTLQEQDLQQLLDNMVFDGKLERMGAMGYRTVRGAAAESRGPDDIGIANGFTEAPCGRCPVFSQCEEGGPVNATSCVYFTEWLARNL